MAEITLMPRAYQGAQRDTADLSNWRKKSIQIVQFHENVLFKVKYRSQNQHLAETNINCAPGNVSYILHIITKSICSFV